MKKGETFTYDFVVPDASLYWYHPHVMSNAQVGYGLYGALLVEDPNDGVGVDESLRVLRDTSNFEAKGFGIYAQDLIQIAPHWKLLAGLRYDNTDGRYNTFGIPADAPGPVTTTSYRQKISEWSKRAGVLYQPNDLQSYHFSYGTSFNTSGDT